MLHRKLCRIKSQCLRKRPFFEDFCKRRCKGRSERLQGGDCDWVKTKKRVRRDCGLCAGRFLNAQFADAVCGIAGNFRPYANEAFRRLPAAALAFCCACVVAGLRDICRLARDAPLYSRVRQMFRFVPRRKIFGETPEISEPFDLQFAFRKFCRRSKEKI